LSHGHGSAAAGTVPILFVWHHVSLKEWCRFFELELKCRLPFSSLLILRKVIGVANVYEKNKNYFALFGCVMMPCLFRNCGQEIKFHFFDRSVAERGIYPAVDPLDSTSRIMDPNVIGHEHYGVARGVQKILQVIF
jgi:hypothetical protein